MERKSIIIEDDFSSKINNKDTIYLDNNSNIINHDEGKLVLPDGGYGWLIVVASFLMQACSFGVAAGFGVFVEFYYTNVFKGAKYSEISLIGTIAPTTMAFASIITGRLCDIFGFRACALSGAALITLSYLLASFSTEIWHLVITQGFIFGLGGGLVYVPANTIITHWFDKHRGLATGIGTAGSGIGGMVFSLLNAKLLPYSGYQWTLRYNAFIFLACLTFSALVIKPYLNEDKHIKRERAPLRKEMVLNGRFILFGLSTTFAAFGYLVPLYFISPYSTFIGLSASQGAILVAILNTSNAVGRIVLGVVGDRFGHFEVYTLCLLLSTLILVIWRFAFTFPVLLVFAILYGFPAGGFAGGFPTACAALFGVENLSTMMGLAYAPTGLGDLGGPPLAGLIFDLTQNYSYLIYYGIGLYFLGFFFVAIIKYLYLNGKKPFHDDIKA